MISISQIALDGALGLYTTFWLPNFKHTTYSDMKHTSARLSTEDDECDGCKIPHLATADTDKGYTLRYVTPCSLVERYLCSRDTFCHHHGRR
jgi:hypothetical protein